MSGIRVMGFDLSLTSAGVAVADMDEKSFLSQDGVLVANPDQSRVFDTWKFTVPANITKQNSGLKDAYINIYYKQRAFQLIDTYRPDVVVLEDVFMGPKNPRMVRSLYNINTSIPVEMVRRLELGEDLAPGVFSHIQNGVWKSWVVRNTQKTPKEYQYDKNRKKLIQVRLAALGYEVPEKDGQEDRYDALGMAVGWYLNHVATGEQHGDVLDSGVVDRLLPVEVWLDPTTL